MLKELLRLAGKTCLYFEIQSRTVIPTIFHELVHIRSRRFPHFLDRKWDHERYVPNKESNEDEQRAIPMDGADRDPLDEAESAFALCFSTKRLLSEPKIIKNSRVVVVGPSDTGISFIEALLSISYLNFTNITLVAPGGLPHHHLEDKSNNLKACSTSYTNAELKKLMLESRIRVINARMVDIDRSDKNVILDDQTVVPYDTLILAMGIQDQTLTTILSGDPNTSKTFHASQGIQPSPEGTVSYEGLLSIDDPYLYEHLAPNSPLIQSLTDRRHNNKCVIYGRTLHTYTLIQGLIKRGVRPASITLAVPENDCHFTVSEEELKLLQEDLPIIYPDSFEDEHIESKIQKMLIEKGITIMSNLKLFEVMADSENKLECIAFKKLDEDEEEEEDEDPELEGGKSDDGSVMTSRNAESQEEENKSQMEEHIEKKKKRKRNEIEMECRVLVCAGHVDVDKDVFKSIHDNGLVYNGRLIVDRNFQTTDPSIFAAGSLCEFSGRYKALSQGRPLRMDRYNGREMGSRLARSVFDIYDPQISNSNDQST
mmetsp:Transcript_108645/g.150250  ORF Transcript_108645/g.150250 Transcript_108645/m.150250 type:complete len:541 (+) Transcript_108645:469-2091(+)